MKKTEKKKSIQRRLQNWFFFFFVWKVRAANESEIENIFFRNSEEQVTISLGKVLNEKRQSKEKRVCWT